MFDVEIEYQDKVPILIFNPLFLYHSDTENIRRYFTERMINDSKEIIIDLSNLFMVDAQTIYRLTEIMKGFRNTIKRFGLVIPKEVNLEGLKIKLIDDFFEIYGSKYDAVYDFYYQS
jgi:anti-anti-sigma regulatory factor